MILPLLFQIFISWLIACCIIKVFNKSIATPDSKIYQEPTLLTSILSTIAIELSLKTKLRIGKVLHHSFGLCFATVYYLIWYCEFTEISWATSIIIGVISALIRIISWTFLLEIIPTVHTANFKGYYLQLVFVHSIFIIAAFYVDWLLL